MRVILLACLGLLLWTPAQADVLSTVVFETTPAGTGTQEITIGFRARFIRVRTHVDTTAGSDAHAHAMFGCAAESAASAITQWAVWGISEDGQGTSDSARSTRTTRVVWTANEAGTVQMEGEVTTWGATSITITWHNVAAQRALVIEAFGGSDLTDATCSTFTFPASTDANLQVTSLAFEPSFLLIQGGALTANGHSGDNHMQIGATDGTSQWSLSVADEDNVGTTDAYSVMRTDLIYQGLNVASGAVVRAASFTSFLSNGFELNASVASGSTAVLPFLAVGGTAQFKVGAFTMPSSVETTVEVTGLAFEPLAFEFLSTSWPASSTVQAHYHLAHGFQIGTATDERAAFTATSEDALDVSDANSFYSTALALSLRYEDGATSGGDMTVTATTSSSFTTTWDDHQGDSFGASVLYWTIGEASGAPAAVPCIAGGGIIRPGCPGEVQ